MKSGECPKCGAEQVFHRRKNQGPYGINRLPISFFYSAAVDSYVCGSCGYVETYVSKPKHVLKIKQKWRRILPRS